MRVRVHATTMEQQRGQARTIGDYVTIQEVGAGSFAVVWKARHKITGDEVAIKEIALEKLNKKLRESLLSEITILRKTNHPNIIRLHDIVEVPGRIFLILEYCAGGDLAAYIHRHGKVPEATARIFMQQLGLGLQVLRKNNLIHRDLKPQNLLLSTDDENAVLKIADFGFARSLQPQGMAETLCGSPLYMAPEILHMQKYDAKADLWSVGAILFQLVTGKPPFLGDSHAQLLLSIRKNEVQFPDAGNLHPDCIDMCRKLLRRNPVERLSFEEFFAHPFMRESASKPPTRTTSTDFDVGEAQSEDCLPFLLDDVPKQSPRLGLPPGHRITSGLSHANILRDPKPPEFEEASRDPFYQRPLDGDVEPEVRFDANSPPKTVGLLDSLEYIEREYVVVKPGDMSMSTSTIDQHASKSEKNFMKPPSPVTHALPTMSRVSTPVEISPVDSDEVLEGPSAHPSTRLPSLQRYARLMRELATDNFDAGRPLDALSVQLVCLAILKEALRLARLPSSNSPEKDEDPAATYNQVHQEFCSAVDRGEAFASQLGNIDVSAEMPDAIEIIFQAALFSGRNGAVDELMGYVSKASVAYAKAVTFLYFLIFEAGPLQLASLNPSDRQRLIKYADMLNARLNVCSRPSSS